MHLVLNDLYNGIGREKAAKALGISLSATYKHCEGERLPTLEQVVELSKLGADVSEEKTQAAVDELGALLFSPARRKVIREENLKTVLSLLNGTGHLPKQEAVRMEVCPECRRPATLKAIVNGMPIYKCEFDDCRGTGKGWR